MPFEIKRKMNGVCATIGRWVAIAPNHFPTFAHDAYFKPASHLYK